MKNILSNKNVKVEVESLGAELKSLNKNGREYIWYSKPEYWKNSAPILFPVVGKLKDLKTTFDGKEYEIPKHGLVRSREFVVDKFTEDTLVYVNRYDEETLKSFPFKYELKVIYTLYENSLSTKLVVKNLDDKEMPFVIGGHPAFNCPLYMGEKFTDYTIYFEKNEDIASPKVMSNATLNFDEIVMNKPNTRSINLDKSLFDIDTIIIKNVKSKSVELLNKDNKGIHFSFNNFNTLSIWTPANEAPFICLEPWHGHNDRYDTDGLFIHKDDVVILKPNEEESFEYIIDIVD